MPEALQFITIGGAAGAFFWVLKWVVDGRLHSDSEVKGLREDKRVLFNTTRELGEAVTEANRGLAIAIPLLKEILAILKEEEDT